MPLVFQYLPPSKTPTRSPAELKALLKAMGTVMKGVIGSAGTVVCRDGFELAGVCFLLKRRGKCFEVCRVVLPAHRGQGIAAKMLSEVIRLFPEHTLEALSANQRLRRGLIREGFEKKPPWSNQYIRKPTVCPHSKLSLWSPPCPNPSPSTPLPPQPLP